MSFKAGDEIELACSVEEFKSKTRFGSSTYEVCFKDGVATISDVHQEWSQFSLVKVKDGSGDLVDFSDIRYLKLKGEVLVQHLWDGVSDLEVGMTVKYQGIDFPVKCISDDGGEVVLYMNCSGLQVVNRSNIKAAKLSHKEETLKKVMEAWKRQGLDFAHDIKGSHAPIENVFNIVYDVMKCAEV